MTQKTAYSTAARSSNHTTNRITSPDYPCPVKAFLTYTVLRLALFVATYAVIITVVVAVSGDRSPAAETALVSLIAAAVISSLLSLKLLAGPRERLAGSVEARAKRASAKFEEIRSREDVD